MSADGPPPDITKGKLEAAEADLGHVRELLERAARGDVDAVRNLTESLREYLQQHGPVLRSVAATVGEEIRRQLLQQLYGWRSQLDDQLGSPDRRE